MLKICKICKIEYEAYDKPRKGRGRKFNIKRPYNSVTCSKKCSKLNYHHPRKDVVPIEKLSNKPIKQYIYKV
jgi:hypothetical protein